MRLDSSLTSTRATPAAAASSGTSCSGVGAYPGSRWWKAWTALPGRALAGSTEVSWLRSRRDDMAQCLPRPGAVHRPHRRARPGTEVTVSILSTADAPTVDDHI